VFTNGLPTQCCLAIGNSTGAHGNYALVAGAGSRLAWYGGNGYPAVGYGANAYQNYLAVSNGGTVAATGSGGPARVGAQAGGYGNYVVVDNANALAGFNVGSGANSHDNYLIITNGGYVNAGISSIGASATSSNNYVIVAGTNAAGARATMTLGYNQFYALTLGTVAGASGNYLQVGAGGQVTGTNYMRCGLEIGYVSGANGNYVVVTNGGLLTINNNNAINVGSYAAGITNGYLYVDGSGSTVNGGGINVGTAPAAIGNRLIVVNGSGVYSPLGIGTAAGATGNYARVTGGGVLEANTILIGNTASSGNTLTNRGGILQFSRATPTIAITNAPANGIMIDGGTVSYRNVGAANVTNNWSETGIGTNGIAWQGANRFRLDNATGVVAAATGYTFATNQPMGAKNYAGLELVNGRTAIGSNITIGAAGGSVLFSNTTATIGGVFTNSGTLTVANSAVTFASNLTLNAGCAVVVTSTNQMPMNVQGVLTLNGGTVKPPPGFRGSDRFTLFTSSNAISGNLASLAVAPATHRVVLGDDAKVIHVVACEAGAMLTVE
jgi:hypothetical protein